jgi:hypothetical protein
LGFSQFLHFLRIFEENDMTRQEQHIQLAVAYQKMGPKGRDVLDRMVRKLARVHEHIALYASPQRGGKQCVQKIHTKEK